MECLHVEDGGYDLSTFVRSSLPKIEEFVRIKFSDYLSKGEVW